MREAADGSGPYFISSCCMLLGGVCWVFTEVLRGWDWKIWAYVEQHQNIILMASILIRM